MIKLVLTIILIVLAIPHMIFADEEKTAFVTWDYSSVEIIDVNFKTADDSSGNLNKVLSLRSTAKGTATGSFSVTYNIITPNSVKVSIFSEPMYLNGDESSSDYLEWTLYQEEDPLLGFEASRDYSTPVLIYEYTNLNNQVEDEIPFTIDTKRILNLGGENYSATISLKVDVL